MNRRRIVDFKLYQESEGLKGLIIALANDGSLWSSLIPKEQREWHQFPPLPSSSNQHRAAPEQWAWVQGDATAPVFSCILELASRLAAVEQRIQAMEGNSQSTPNDRQIRSSAPAGGLVERVHSCIVGEPECGHMQARAAIREVIDWLAKDAVRGSPHWIAAADISEEVERHG